MEATRETLLERVRDLGAQGAWREFFALYHRPILFYAQKLGLSETDAQDVLQETMVALLRSLPTFQYNPSKGKFRNFLFTIVHRRCLAALRRWRTVDSLALDEPLEEGAEPLGERLAAEPEPGLETADWRCWEEALLSQALAELRGDPSVAPRTQEIFRAYAMERLPAEEVAQRFGVAPNVVYQIKNRLMRRLQHRVEELLEVA
jgi:RNA polymerase sigma factor (sigma-70 family)